MEERAGLSIYTPSHVINLGVMSLSDRQCHSMKRLCGRDFGFVQRLTGEHKQQLTSPICYHLHVEHIHGALMLM